MNVARWLAVTALAVMLPAAAQDEYTLLVFGDSGTGRERQRRVAEAMGHVCRELGCDAALVLGDLIYPRGVKSVDDRRFATHFEEPYSVVEVMPFWMAPGNHDHARARSVAAEIAYARSGNSERWQMPAAHYPVGRLPPWLHVYSLDTEPIVEGSADGTQGAQARAALCDKSGWRILMGHHPIYSNGPHGDYAELGEYLEGLIGDCAVQAYFAGHDHHQEHISSALVEQFVQGAAAKLRRVRGVRYAPDAPMSQRFARSTLGFAIATFTARAMEVRFFDGTTGRALEIYRCRATIEAPTCVPQ